MSTVEKVHSTNPNQVEWIRLTLGVAGSQAIQLLQIYGFIQHRTEKGQRFEFDASKYGRKVGTHRNTVGKYFKKLCDLGWIVKEGSYASVDRIPFDEPPKPVTKPEPKKETKPKAKPETKRERKPKANSNQELINCWNECKPKQWAALQSLSPSRLRTIKKLGGFQATMDLIRRAMPEVKKDSFWGNKPMKWENFLGAGEVPKGHIHAFAEASCDPNPDKLKPEKPAEHPDFFPPTPWCTDLRPKHGHFKREDGMGGFLYEDRPTQAEAKAEAFKFYNFNP